MKFSSLKKHSQSDFEVSTLNTWKDRVQQETNSYFW